MTPMTHVLLGARLLLAAVFATAAAGKLLDVAGSRKALADFGVPQRAVAVAGLLLPLAELAVAVALIPQGSARWAAAGALVLLVAFIAGIANALRRGQAPDCHCFGQIQSAPAGPSTLVRNGLLAVLAAVVALSGPGPELGDWVAARTGAELGLVVLGVAATVLGALSLGLWRANSMLRRDLDDAQLEIAANPAGLAVGLPAPSFVLKDLDGDPRTLRSLCERGRDVALIFATPDCAGCRQLLPDVGRWQTSLGDRLTIAVVTTGSADRNRAAFAEHGIGDVLLQEATEVLSDYRVRATPTAVLVDQDGRIASAAVAGAVTIESLIRISLRREEAGLVLGSAVIGRPELTEIV